jgi:hypothetical protein
LGFSYSIIYTHYIVATVIRGDYDLLSVILVFSRGSADGVKVCASVTVNSDNLVETEEDFGVILTLVSSGPNLGLGNNVSTIVLIDNEGTQL